MSFTIRQPSTNSDKLGPGGVVIPGTPDSVLTFQNVSGEIAVKSDISAAGTTTYVLQNTYTDATTDDPQVITEWDVPVVAGKLYKFEYLIYATKETNTTSLDFRIYYQTSSFTNPLIFQLTGGSGNFVSPESTGTYDLSTATSGLSLTNINTSQVAPDSYSGIFKATETGTLRHLVQNPNGWIPSQESASYISGESCLRVTQLN